MNKPFFSILIPTYNRMKDLERAIYCILQNDFKDFEIIVADNNSKDNIRQVVNKFKSKKIVYFKNKKNIGWIRNLKKGMKIAKGKYVIFHGDDDFIIYEDTLTKAHKILKENNFGFLRFNFLRLSYNKKNIFDYYKKIFKDVSIAPNQKSTDIVEFLTKAEIHFVSGIAYRNYKYAYQDMIYSESGPWFKVLFKNVNKYGGYLLSKHSFMAQWSRSPSYHYYILQKGKLTVEAYYDEISKVVSKEYYKKILKNELKIQFKLMPAAKLYTNLQNFLNYSRRIIYLSPEFKYSLTFWTYFLGALFTPKFILRIIRSYYDSGYRSYKIPNHKKIVKKIKFLNQHLKYTNIL